MIAIHARSGSFSDRWIEYCEEHGVAFRTIDCLSNDIVQEARHFDALLWHWHHGDPSDVNVARQVVMALEYGGMIVYPNVQTCWHYDDKIAQKYLLESIGAPLIRSWVFNDQQSAARWIATASWPKVFKLRCGAGAKNVQLARTRAEAERLCGQAFGKGFPASASHLNDLKNRLRQTSNIRHFFQRLYRAPSAFSNRARLRRELPVQRGYLYFQEFVPGNTFDTRVVVIGDRAFAFLRYNRPGDFRASGSGDLCFDPDKIDKECVRSALQVAKRLGTQSLAFDFLTTPTGAPALVEISYAFRGAMRHCPGFWDDQLNWHDGSHRHEDLILEVVLEQISARHAGRAILSQS